MKRLPSCGNVIRTCSPISPYQCLKKLSTWIGFKILVSEKLSSSKVLNRTPNYIQTMFDLWNLVIFTRICGIIIHWLFVIFGSGFNQGMHFPAPRPQCQLFVRIKGNFVWTFFTLKLNPAGGWFKTGLHID